MRMFHAPFFLAFITVAIGSAGLVSAAPPKKPKASQYTRLWTNSPFTIKPTAAKPTQATPLERDWMIGSIRPSGDGYSVTLINKKDRKDRIRFIPGFSANGYELLNVKQDVKNNENSRVQIKKDGQTAWISYDAKLIKVRPTVTAKSNKKGARGTSGAQKTGTAKKGSVPPIPSNSTTKTSNKSSGNRVRSVPSR